MRVRLTVVALLVTFSVGAGRAAGEAPAGDEAAALARAGYRSPEVLHRAGAFALVRATGRQGLRVVAIGPAAGPVRPLLELPAAPPPGGSLEAALGARHPAAALQEVRVTARGRRSDGARVDETWHVFVRTAPTLALACTVRGNRSVTPTPPACGSGFSRWARLVASGAGATLALRLEVQEAGRWLVRRDDRCEERSPVRAAPAVEHHTIPAVGTCAAPGRPSAGPFGPEPKSWRVVYDDLHGLWGGTTIAVRGDGAVVGLARGRGTAFEVFQAQLPGPVMQQLAGAVAAVEAAGPPLPLPPVMPPDTSLAWLRVTRAGATTARWERHNDLAANGRIIRVRDLLEQALAGRRTSCRLPPPITRDAARLGIGARDGGLLADLALRPGQSVTLAVGRPALGASFEPLATCVYWREWRGAGVSVDPFTGHLAVAPGAPGGETFAVVAHVDSLVEPLRLAGVVYTRASHPLVGVWKEVAQLGCARRTWSAPARPLRELELRIDGSFGATWTPFEVYKDYWGRYAVEPATRKITFRVAGHNRLPAGLRLTGTVTYQDAELTLEGLWLGAPPEVTAPPACGHRFERVQ